MLHWKSGTQPSPPQQICPTGQTVTTPGSHVWVSGLHEYVEQLPPPMVIVVPAGVAILAVVAPPQSFASQH